MSYLVTRCCQTTAYLVETTHHSYYSCDNCGRPTELIKIKEGENNV